MPDTSTKISELRDAIRQFASHETLLAVHRVMKNADLSRAVAKGIFQDENPGAPPFVLAGIADFAIRYSNPYRYPERRIQLPDFAKLTAMFFEYLSGDPIVDNDEIRTEFYKSNPIFAFLRILSSQFRFEMNLNGFLGQSSLLFLQMPKEIAGAHGVPNFDFLKSFESVAGLSVKDFLIGGFTAYAVAISHQMDGFTREYFEKARTDGLRIPTDEQILALLNSLSADPKKFRKEYENRKQADIRFSMYDFNKLYVFSNLFELLPIDQKSFIDDRIDEMTEALRQVGYYNRRNGGSCLG